MRKELFGVFGDRSDFERFRSHTAFDRILEGPEMTVGVRTSELGIPGRTTVSETERGTAVLWGEVYPESIDGIRPARWFADRYAKRGHSALEPLNGSFLAAVDTPNRDAMVATDPVRSRELYYADIAGTRIFSTDPASVSRFVEEPILAPEPLREFVQFGTVFDDRTVLESVRRVPFDSYLTATDTVQLDRFVYERRDFDYVGELAARLKRALERRSRLPGRKGLLLSGGYDSRAMVAGMPDVEVAYTIGHPGTSEVEVARDIAAQYDTRHETLEMDGRYFNTGSKVARHTHGIMESVHVHHAGYTDQMNVDTVYHGYLGDTLLRGHFLPVDGVELFGRTWPPYRLDPDPDPPATLIEKFSYQESATQLLRESCDMSESGPEFFERRIHELRERWSHRFESKYDGIALLGIQNQPTRAFRYHLGDTFLESCVMLDAELIDWHLSTPPEKRNTRTFLRALERIDSDILQTRPPDRPFDTYTLNQVQNFLRRKLPGVSGYEGPWPERRQLYDEHDIDENVFSDHHVVSSYPWRLKLRINDITTWLDGATHDPPITKASFLEPIQEEGVSEPGCGRDTPETVRTS